MKLAVFSDIHGNLTAFEAAWRDYEMLGGADHLWFLGDFAAAGSRPAECIRRVREIVAGIETDEDKKGRVRTLRGNTDRYLVTGERMRQKPVEKDEDFPKFVSDIQNFNTMLLWNLSRLSFEDYEFLAKLAPECDVDVPGYGHVIGYHGTPGDDEGFLTPDMEASEAGDALLDREGRLGIGGHIHRQMDRVIGGWRVINVGSVGMSFDMPAKAQWGLFTFENNDVTVDLRAVPYDMDAAIADLHSTGYPVAAWAEKRLRQSKTG
jgi:predicted phosphodiesterase